MQSLKDRTDYATNKEKTDGGQLVSSYGCDPKTVEEEFALSKREYYQITGRRQLLDVIAYQIRQSFKPGEVTAEEANRIGYETAMRWTKGNHAFIVATHIDRAHIHNHIIYNSTNLSCDGKFQNFIRSGVALQKVSDLVCLENGLSVIQKVKPSQRVKRTEYPNRKSYREQIRDALDICMEQKPKTLEELLGFLAGMGYEIKRGKYIAVRGKGQTKFLRFRTLGAGYREEDFEKIFAGIAEGKENVWRSRKQTEQQDGKQFGNQTGMQNEKQTGKTATNTFQRSDENKFDMLLNIQEIIARGKGPGYERWAKVHNLKQMAQTLLFLQEHGVRDPELLAQKAKETSEKFSELNKRQKELEEELGNIATLKKHIINYSKTKEVYAEYRKSGYSKKFFEEHRDSILLHKAAKEAFSKIQGQIPKIRELNEAYERILREKKKNYAEYRQARQDMKAYQTAKYNIDQFLRRDEEEKQKKERDKMDKMNKSL